MAASPVLDADYDSSDIEFDIPSHPWNSSSAGQKSINKIFENAALDRVSSKRAIKELEYRHGAPGTQARQTLWIRRFEAFRQAIQQDLDQPFTGDDILRFLEIIIGKLSDRESSGFLG
jgi:hypothetical protein